MEIRDTKIVGWLFVAIVGVVVLAMKAIRRGHFAPSSVNRHYISALLFSIEHHVKLLSKHIIGLEFCVFVFAMRSAIEERPKVNLN